MKIVILTKTKDRTVYQDKEINTLTEIYESITATQSILINRTDLKDFLYTLNPNNYKQEFQTIKHYLRSNYQVHKLYFNPRTFEFFPRNKCFLIHNK